ncbi:hypothetical protein AB0M61_27255 [Streptomyces sp. NPDC051642]|uniref:hypothetical protein n=1 Tax=Streptomyces sp. NPDC051642 TaxID=3154646 RepID=UPI00341A3DEF
MTVSIACGQRGTRLTKDRASETYLSNLRISGYVGDPLLDGKAKTYRFAGDIPVNSLSLDGTWTAGYRYFTAGDHARLAFTCRAGNANGVLAGKGTVTVLVDGKVVKTIPVEGTPNLYKLVDDSTARTAHLELRLTPGIQAYSFIFGWTRTRLDPAGRLPGSGSVRRPETAPVPA